MKLNDSIRKRVELFTKPKFISQYETIMTSMANSIPSPKKKPTKKLLFNDQTKRSKSYWDELIKGMFNSQSNDTVPLDEAYLKLKAKNTISKLALIAALFDISLTQVIKHYFVLCHNELAGRIYTKRTPAGLSKTQLNSFKNSFVKELKDKSEINNKNNDANSSITCVKHGEPPQEEVKDIQDDIVLEPKQKRMIHIFVGQADFKKLIAHKQKIVMEKGKYCQTFIISDIDDNSNCSKKPPMNPSMSQKKNNYIKSQPMTCKSFSSKNKSFCLNADLAMKLKTKDMKHSAKGNFNQIRLRDFSEKENCASAFPSITPKPKKHAQFWRYYPRHNAGPISLLPKSHSQALGLTYANQVNHKGKNKHFVDYINKGDLYY